jgi:hypothetical protein
MSIFKNIPRLFTDTLKDENLQDLTLEISEVVLDSVMDEGLLKDIPGLSTLVGIFKTSANYKDRAFLKKIFYFISQVNSISADEREKVISEIDNSKKYRIKLGEKLLYIIDKCDDHEKSEIIGTLFSKFLSREISYDDFLRCSLVIEKCMVYDLLWFIKEEKDTYSISYSSELVNWGILEIEPLKLKIVNNSRKVGNETDFALENNELKLIISNTGKIIREELLGYAVNQIKEIGLIRMNFNELESYIVNLKGEFPDHYTEDRLKYSYIFTITEMCNNSNISDSEFDKLVTTMILSIRHKYISSADRDIIEINRKEKLNGNDFNFKRWENFNEKFRKIYQENLKVRSGYLEL